MKLFTTVKNGFVIGTLNANTDEKHSAIGFLSPIWIQLITTQKNIKPRIVENYDGSDILPQRRTSNLHRRCRFP